MWLSLPNSASLCSSALLCACISHLSVHSIGFTFQPSLLLPPSIESSCLTMDLGRFHVGTWDPQAHSTAAWHSACSDIPLQWEQLLVSGSGPGADSRQSWPSSFTRRNQASSLWRPYKQMPPLALLHKTGQPQILVSPGWANLVPVLLSIAPKLVAASLHHIPVQCEQREVRCKAQKKDTVESLVKLHPQEGYACCSFSFLEDLFSRCSRGEIKFSGS